MHDSTTNGIVHAGLFANAHELARFHRVRFSGLRAFVIRKKVSVNLPALPAACLPAGRAGRRQAGATAHTGRRYASCSKRS
jgi:hypothetical protein